MAAAAEILANARGGVHWAYQLLDDVATRHHLSDAWLVVKSGRARSDDVGAPQLFSLGARPVQTERARALLRRPPGVYGEPRNLDSSTNAAVGAMCELAFRASAGSMGAAIDPESGLANNAVIDASLMRAAACGARYGWSSTLVVLTTGGDAPHEDRWPALAAAVRQARRSGDDVGVAAPGIAMAVLGNAGPDAVRPFVGRVRAELSAAGWEDVDLHAATARTPEETVDPEELVRLATERLEHAGAVRPSTPDAATGLELELRLLPEVVWVAIGTPVVVVSTSASASLHDQALRTVRRHLPHASVSLVAVDDPSEDVRPAPATGAGAVRLTHGNGNGNGSGIANGAARPEEASGPRAISATAPGGSRRTSAPARVSLLGATFDAATGTSEVSLSLGAARGVGRAPSGPLAGGAQATLNALDALAVEVPFYLVSAERAHGVPGEPVVVVLAPRRGAAGGAGEAVERLGVATGDADVEAASRATLGALNRHLAKSAPGR